MTITKKTALLSRIMQTLGGKILAFRGTYVAYRVGYLVVDMIDGQLGIMRSETVVEPGSYRQVDWGQMMRAAELASRCGRPSTGTGEFALA